MFVCTGAMRVGRASDTWSRFAASWPGPVLSEANHIMWSGFFGSLAFWRSSRLCLQVYVVLLTVFKASSGRPQRKFKSYQNCRLYDVSCFAQVHAIDTLGQARRGAMTSMSQVAACCAVPQAMWREMPAGGPGNDMM